VESEKKSYIEGQEINYIGLYLHNLGANLVGFITIATLNIFTPLYSLEKLQIFILTEGGWTGFFFFFPLVIALVFIFQFHILRPVTHISALIHNRDEIPIDLQEKARKRLLNLPSLIALVNLAIYIVIPCVVISMFYFFMHAALKTCLFLFLRAFMVGLITASLSFFLFEDYSRKTLIPYFFPKGRLATIGGTIKIPILRRIRLLNMAGTLNPMVILVITLLFIVWEIKEKGISADQLSREIFLFTIILCGFFLAIVLSLNVLVGNSFLKPIKAMLSVIEKIKSGDFTQRIRVLSNDEIGLLGDAGNDMIRGLAEREKIRDTFGKYVTPEIRDKILSGDIPLNGEMRTATLLFSDLRDFTAYVEANSPEEVIKSMRAYFTAMQKAIRLHHGLVLQYVGDEIEAVFGVPLSYDGHTDKAILAALEMRKSLEDLNRQRVMEGKVPFRHGIGIHTGEVLAGNTGSKDRLSYALIGNTVNLASRIQELTKECQCDILVSEEAVKGLKNAVDMKEALSKMVKGYSKPITVFKIL